MPTDRGKKYISPLGSGVTANAEQSTEMECIAHTDMHRRPLIVFGIVGNHKKGVHIYEARCQ